MGNKQPTYLKDPSIKELATKFKDPLEMHMLCLIFEDLSARSDGVIDKETFLKFFPLTGLWGERLFINFNTLHTGHINLKEWLQGFLFCCRSNEEKQIEMLFKLYDLDNDGYIEKKDMITMLYNYPKEHLTTITADLAQDDGRKLKPINEMQRDSVLSIINVEQDKNKTNQVPKPVVDDDWMPVPEEIKAPCFDEIKREFSNVRSVSFLKTADLNASKSSAPKIPQNKVVVLNEQPLKIEKVEKYEKVPDSKRSSDSNNPTPSMSYLRKMSSTAIITDQSFIATSTVNSRVREYANFLFKNTESIQNKGKISLEDFKIWIKNHENILKIFTDTFHQEIWNVRDEANFDNKLKLRYHLKKPEFSGVLYKRGKKSKKWVSRYFELRDHFLFYYKNKETELPKGIFYLEGCNIEQNNDFYVTKKYGFNIAHKSSSYRNRNFYCNTQQELDRWMAFFKTYQNSSVHDKYNFLEKIGTGKFSTVYHATLKSDTKQEYAIKVMDKIRLKPSEIEFIFLETSIMKVLEHPHIIKLIETIETRTSIYIVTEIVKNGDLFEHIVSNEFLEEYQAQKIMKQLLNSFNYLHSTGVIHRDIKPENILITSDANKEVQNIKLIDFGFAKYITPDIQLKETCGTPNYVGIPPEILKGVGYDKRADIWSLGILLYFMLRGRLPFDSENVDDILIKTLTEEINLEDYHFRRLSNEGRDFLGRFLHKDPEKRIRIQDALQHPWIQNKDNFLLKYKGSNRNK